MEKIVHYEETLSDNTKIEYCKQCKDCIFWGNGSAFENAYDKACCSMFPNPDTKPIGVIDNTEDCEYRQEGRRE